ncbi:MAG TPA: M56 family metallopeptidase [Phycisphaerae bacterium]|jgi:beta-lactamase regulating signal transducer with metallopeptidase domain|nr:M56 family metallopeptidase [Phycisphaerae bacterium]
MDTRIMNSGYWLVAGWTMLHFLWVGVVIGLFATAGRLVLSSAQPVVRYTFALGCLVLLALAPLAIGVVVANDNPTPIVTVRSDGLSLPREGPDEALGLTLSATTTGRPVDAGSAAAPSLLSLAKEAAFTAVRYLPWVWLTGSPLAFLLVITGLAGAERLGRQSTLLTTGIVPDTCQRLLGALCMTRRVAVGVCHRLKSPVLIGILRPIILLPPAALAGWSPEQLEMVLLHELAHVRRWDNLVNLFQRIVESILFFHPVVWLVSEWVRAEREHCCDQVVLAYTRQPRAYAELLAGMVLPISEHAAFAAMGEANVVARIRRVLKLRDETMKLSRKAVSLAVCVLLVSAALVGISTRISTASSSWLQSIMFGQDRDPSLERDPGINEPPARPKSSNASPREPIAQDIAPQPAPESVVTLRLLDQDGNPVEGVNLALRTRWTGGNRNSTVVAPSRRT